jgi:DNA-binding CsgD family transcriptional regulator
MRPDVHKFFISDNRVSAVISEEDYKNAASILTALDALARMTYQSMYVIDYYNKNFLYVSENPLFLCGNTPETVRKMGYTFYLQHVPPEEIDMLLEINRAGFEFCAHMPVEDKMKHTISYDFHILNEKRKTLVNHKLTPLVSAGDGSVWLAACLVSLSSHKETGHIEMYRAGAANYWIYSLESHKWQPSDNRLLSDRERDILLLSARGYTVNNIADRLCLAPDTVKFHKRQLFERLNVNNITEALGFAANCKLL